MELADKVLFDSNIQLKTHSDWLRFLTHKCDIITTKGNLIKHSIILEFKNDNLIHNEDISLNLVLVGESIFQIKYCYLEVYIQNIDIIEYKTFLINDFESFQNLVNCSADTIEKKGFCDLFRQLKSGECLKFHLKE